MSNQGVRIEGVKGARRGFKVSKLQGFKVGAKAVGEK